MPFASRRSLKATRPAHHANNLGTSFQNPWPSASTPTWAELVSLSFPFAWYSPVPPPDHIRPLKVVEPDWGSSRRLRKSSGLEDDYIVATWLGHAGAMVEFPPLLSQGNADQESIYFVYDPMFSFRAGPTQYTGPSRFRETPCKVTEFPGCHAAFISHNHYDHMDSTTLNDINLHFPHVKWFVPLGNKAWLLDVGVPRNQVIELDWWQSWEGSISAPESGLKTHEHFWYRITCVPAQHNSGRKGFDGGSALWCGWVAERFSGDVTSTHQAIRLGSVYHAGDTGYRRMEGSKDVCPVFKEIGNKFNGFDLSFIPIWRGGSLGFISYAGLRLLHQQVPSALHCSPADAVNIHRDVKSKNTIAIHFGTFVGSEEESREAVLEFYEACELMDVKSLESEEVAENGRAGTLDIGASHFLNFT